MTLLHIDSSYHVIRQKLSLLDGPPSPEAHLEPSGSNAHLPLPNPFKAALMGLKSSESLAQEKGEDGGRVLLTHTSDLGLLPLSAPSRALRLIDSDTLSWALAWSSEQLNVSSYSCFHSMAESLHYRCSMLEAFR